MDDQFCLKATSFLGRKVSFLCQNENGPCPLLAICNVLILRRQITLPPNATSIASADLIQILANRLIEANPPLKNEELALSQEKNLNDVILNLPHLLVGLDVNIRFQSINDFEFTTELATFDLLDIQLVHGWLYDPNQEPVVADLINRKSYNELVEIVIESQSAASSPGAIVQSVIEELVNHLDQDETFHSQPQDPPVPKGAVIAAFLEQTASQLTEYGLKKLQQEINERRLCVFFRNNHFSTLFKYQGDLYLLVTDTGYYDEPAVVWERLTDVAGDTGYFNETFQSLAALQTGQEEPQIVPTTPIETDPPLEDDFQLALRLQKEEDEAATRSSSAAPPPPPPAPPLVVSQTGEVVPTPSQLEAEERYYQQLQQQQHRKPPPKKKSSADCSIQ